MAKKRRKIEPSARPEPAGAGAVLGAVALAVVLAGTALVVDSGAAAAFDAPKRLIAVLGIAAAAAAVFAFGRRGDGALLASAMAPPPERRFALFLAAATLALAVLSALVSPRRTVSLDAMRAIVLFALLLPLGASRAAAVGRRWLVGVFLGATAVNSLVSILQSRNLYQPFPLETMGARQETGAFAGNVGYLAIALALAAVLALGLLVYAPTRARRLTFGAALALFLAALFVNLNLTALTSTFAGAAVLLVVRYRRRALVPMGAAVLVAAAAVAAYAPLRQRAREISVAARIGNWDALVSFRGGAWAAGVEMTRERPLLGYGPGTFGAEYIPHRLAAEIRAKRRFVAPLLTTSYAEAHCDYLQVFSDAGIPAGIAAIGSLACLLVAVGRAAVRRGSTEAAILFAVLAAGATAALTWFPLQRPVTAVPLLLAAGRAWRISGDGEESRGES